MNDQSKIEQQRSKAGSLFERADAVFGLDRINPGAVPENLPAARKPAQRLKQGLETQSHRPQARAEQDHESAPASPAHPVEAVVARERAVTLHGPRIAIDRENLRDEGMIVPEDPVSGLLEEFRIVKRELLADARASDDANARQILVCSPHPGEGKTYCAANLAIALAAERDIEVVLIDADMLNPTISRMFDIEAQPGFMDCIADASIRPEDLVCPTDIGGLFVMPAGTGSVRDAEYLTSARTGVVLDRLMRGAGNRFVVFDTPPALSASPAAELASYAGQAVLVVRADQTGKAALEDARQLLSSCADIKLLLNAAQFSPSGRRFGDYGYRET